MDGKAPADTALIEACRAGQRDAADELMRRHQPALVRTVLRLVRRRSVAEEIVQETFLRTFRDIGRIDPERGIRPWFFRVALNLARRHNDRDRHAALTAEHPDDAEVYLAPPAETPEQQLLVAEESRRLDRAIGALSPKLREVVLLRYVEELPFSEVSAVTGVPVPILKMRALRARARLLALLSEAIS